MFIKNTKKTPYCSVQTLRITLPQGLTALRLLFFREVLSKFVIDLNTLLSSGQKGVLLAPSLAFGQKAQDRSPVCLCPAFHKRGWDNGCL